MNPMGGSKPAPEKQLFLLHITKVDGNPLPILYHNIHIQKIQKQYIEDGQLNIWHYGSY